MTGGEQTIALMVASMSGTAEMVATTELAQEIKNQGLAARISGMENANLSLF